MCEYLGYDVKELKRVRIMNIKLDTEPGKWRFFTKKELSRIHLLLKNSHKTTR